MLIEDSSNEDRYFTFFISGVTYILKSIVISLLFYLPFYQNMYAYGQKQANNVRYKVCILKIL